MEQNLNNTTNKLSNTTQKILNSTVGVASNGMSNFMDILKTYNIIGVCLGMLIATSVYEIVKTIINSIILPTFKEFTGNTEVKSTKVRIGIVTFEVEELLKQLLNFFFLILIILFVFKFLITLENPVTYVKVIKD